MDRGFLHERTGALLCPAGFDWENHEYDFTPLASITLIMHPRVKEKLRTGELMVSWDQWPIFFYSGYSYDAEDPWKGLFRSTILVSVGLLFPPHETTSDHGVSGLQTYFHFTELC